MKTGILTYYNVHNHGALLQAYALKTVMEKMGAEVSFLRFNRNYDRMSEGSENKYNVGLKSIPFLMKYFMKNGMGTFLYNYKKRRSLNKFRATGIPFGPRYSDNDCDYVCVGSDEVFALDVGTNPFFYGHGLNGAKVFSYAGCFGETTLDDVRNYGLSEMVKSGFDKMQYVGVRDENSYTIADALGEKTPELVCDPVILYGYHDEINDEANKVKCETPYILLYSYDKNSNSPAEVRRIRDFAKKKGCKVYSVGYYHKWCDKNIVVSPFELLNYIKNAEFVVTDTFHGSVMSIVTNAQFAVLLRKNSNKLRFLLSEYGLCERIMSDFAELSQKESEAIDFDKVNSIVDEKRRTSMLFLEKCLRS